MLENLYLCSILYRNILIYEKLILNLSKNKILKF